MGGSEAALPPAEGLLKAGEVARLTGITRQMLHLYVQMGLLEPAAHTPRGQRLFARDALERVDLIRKLCRSGYSLKGMRETFIQLTASPPAGRAEDAPGRDRG
jgi:DNA-binding transcriptional MerR regulator